MVVQILKVMPSEDTGFTIQELQYGVSQLRRIYCSSVLIGLLYTVRVSCK
jgi:hypothetical protein